MITMNVFKIIQTCKRKGFRIQEIHTETGIDRKTIAKYFNMSSQEFLDYRQNAYAREHAFEVYKDEIIEIYALNGSNVYVSSVYDLLEETHAEKMPGTQRTLRNYITHLKKTNEISRKLSSRIYKPVDELPFGQQLQVDFGEIVIASGERIYLFTAVLSASRYRYVSAQSRPFKAIDVISHLIDCFEYIGGIPHQLVIDQDCTMVASENEGDVLLTKQFAQFKEEMGFSLFVCRGSDPESKGKVENLVKFVKSSFFSARTFHSLSAVQQGLSDWLVRTANGKLSQATGIAPVHLLAQEQAALKPLRASVFQRDPILDREDRKVDNKSFISVNASMYSVPIKYRQATVWIYKSETTLFVYDTPSGKEIAQHPLSAIPGKKAYVSQHFRDTSKSLATVREELVSQVSLPLWKEFIGHNFKRYKRYYREQQRHLQSFVDTAFDTEILESALGFCLENAQYSAHNLADSYTYFEGIAQEQHSDILPHLLTGIQAIKNESRSPKVAKRKLQYYSSLVSILGGQL